MAHGGTNFGFWAGANSGSLFDITSYDYDCPISEDGCTGQPGIGGRNKYRVRDGWLPALRALRVRDVHKGTVHSTSARRLPIGMLCCTAIGVYCMPCLCAVCAHANQPWCRSCGP
jgi:Glycosyl hydrolases family 35